MIKPFHFPYYQQLCALPPKAEGFPYYQPDPQPLAVTVIDAEGVHTGSLDGDTVKIVDDWEGTYNGWTNRATWNVALWVHNDRSLYDAWKASSEAVAAVKAEAQADTDEPVWDRYAVQSFLGEVWPDGQTPDGDKVAEANLAEIAANWNESWADHH